MAEVQALLGGTTAVTSQPGDPLGQTPNSCAFQQQDAGGHLLVVTVRGSFTKSKFNDLMAQFSGTAVSAVGDAAFLVRASAFVAILRGSTEVMLERNNPLVSQDDVDSLEALARTAAGRL